jgi:hypothetical protein
MRHHLLPILSLVMFGALLSSAVSFAAADEPSGQDHPAHIAGDWQIQWEARLGTEKATVRFQQDGSKLTGVFHGHLGSPTVSGTVQGNTATFTFEFTGKYPFTLTFTGPVEGDRMGGKFQVGGVPAGYDAQGENARPTDYSWRATRIPGKADDSSSNPQ